MARLSAVWLMPGLRSIRVKRGETARTFADLLRAAREGLEDAICAMRKLKPDPVAERTEIDRFGTASPLLPRRCRPLPLLPWTAIAAADTAPARPPTANCFISNYICLYNARQHAAEYPQKVWQLQRTPNPREEFHASSVSPACVSPPPSPPSSRRDRRSFAQDKTFELKLAHWVPPSHPLQKALEDWGSSVEKASGGTIKFKVYPSQQLGKAFDHYDMARDGIADLTYINPGYQPGRFPIIGAGELPFLITNAKGGSQALDAWYRKYAGKEMKDVKFCLAFVHDPGTFHSKTKKIMVPGDIKGMKIRPAHATMATFVTQLGGTNVQSERAGSARHARKGRGRRGDLPVGLDPAVRHRQGHQVSHRRAALRDHLRLRVQHGQLQPDVGGAEEGDRRSLHQRVGVAGRRARGPTSSMPASPS